MLSNTTKFIDAQEAWFWFVNCEKARKDGARFVAGIGKTLRPCEPADIALIVKRLVRQGKISVRQQLVMGIFGHFGYAPDPNVRPRNTKYNTLTRGDACGRDEREAHTRWSQAMQVLQGELIRKGIV